MGMVTRRKKVKNMMSIKKYSILFVFISESGSSSSPSPSVTKTTVANATLYDIYVVCEGDRHPDQQPKYTAEIYGMVFGYTTEGPPVKHEQGLVRIPSGTHHDFHSNCANMFYITIYYLDDDYNCKYFYKGFTVPRDTNVILSHSGHLLLADTKSTWIDKNKRDHQCYADKVLKFKEEVDKLKKKYKDSFKINGRNAITKNYQ